MDISSNSLFIMIVNFDKCAEYSFQSLKEGALIKKPTQVIPGVCNDQEIYLGNGYPGRLPTYGEYTKMLIGKYFSAI